MSVLLEALKKAAEDKKQSSQKSQMDVADLKENSLVSHPLKLKNFEQQVQLGSSESALDIQDESAAKEGRVQKAFAYPIRLMSEQETLQSDTVSMDRENEVDNKTRFSNKTSEKASEKASKKTSLQDDDAAKKELNRERKHSELEKSYYWSLNDLPGYKPIDDLYDASISNSEKNTVPNTVLSSNKRFIKALKTMTLRQVIFGRSSNWAIYSLLSVLILSSVSFFSVYYFQLQVDALDKNMNQYHLARTDLPSEQASNLVFQSGSLEAIKIQPDSKNTMSEKVMAKAINTTPTSVKETVKELQNSALKANLGHITKPVSIPVKKDPPQVDAPQVSNSQTLVIRSSNQVSDMQMAYVSLYNNDLSSASALFNEIITKDPTNVSGLNGYASTQALLGNKEVALDAYQKVLAVDPNNLHAFEAMVSILGETLSGSEWIPEIKKVLKIYPNSSVLNYALGNLYATQSDWKTAQTYYFDAYSLDEQNADYLVNLAVSLDHLGQYQLAEKYYTFALVYAGSQTVSFDEAPIKQRLVSIRQFIGSNNK